MPHKVIKLGLALLFVVAPALPAWADASIKVNPAQGFPGVAFEISGQGFGSGEVVQIDWDGNRLAKTRADSEGRFTLNQEAPAEAAPGEHTITATGRPSKLTAKANFTVLAPPTTTTSATATTVASAGGSPSTTMAATTSKSGGSESTTKSSTTGSSDTATGSSGGEEIPDGGPAEAGETDTDVAAGEVAQPEETGATSLAVSDERPDRPVAFVDIEVSPTSLGLMIVAALVVGIALLMLWLYRSPKEEKRPQPASPWA